MQQPREESKSSALVFVTPWQTVVVKTTEQPGVRARARAELLAEVGRVARAHLAESGAAALSVRAIARDLGLASSALYRYYPSRDALLTRLIIEAYDELGEAVEAHEATVDRADLAGRFAAICQAVRDWARTHPHEYALIYGSPVPGYSAPDDTIDPAVRVARVLMRLAAEVDPVGVVVRVDGPLDPGLLEQFAALTDTMETDIDGDVLALGVTLWAQLFGIVSFELFGTFNNTFEPADAIFEHHVRLGIVALGLA
jgi:AcrR family transcriptional regulator